MCVKYCSKCFQMLVHWTLTTVSIYRRENWGTESLAQNKMSTAALGSELCVLGPAFVSLTTVPHCSAHLSCELRLGPGTSMSESQHERIPRFEAGKWHRLLNHFWLHLGAGTRGEQGVCRDVRTRLLYAGQRWLFDKSVAVELKRTECNWKLLMWSSQVWMLDRRLGVEEWEEPRMRPDFDLSHWWYCDYLANTIYSKKYDHLWGF